MLAPMGPIFIVLGGPAVGKSTTCRLIADALPLSIHLPVDDIRHMVRGGLAMPAVRWTDAIRRQVTLGREAALAVAERYAAEEFAVVMDDFWDPHDAAEYREVVQRPGVHGVVLYAPREVARQRNRVRSPGPEGDFIEGAITFAYDVLESVLDRLPDEGWQVLDTSALTPKATAAAILGAAGIRSGLEADA
jgi:predicted kinase